MYSKFFDFSEKPFDVTPDPKFLYLSPAHREMLASLIYGIRERRGFITIVGEVGTGKTTLLNALLDRIEENTKVAFIFYTNVTFKQMLNLALYEWGLIKSKDSLSKVDAIHLLNNFAIQQLGKGGNVALIVDEAQHLSSRALENLRLLSNLETPKHKLVQIVLSGQPELDTKLGRHELRQLAQRISFKRYITPLNEKDTYDYVQHRLAIAGYKGPSLFNRRAKQLIWEYSGGVPRRINILCDNVFLIGYGLNRRKINEPIVQEAIKDLCWSPFSETIETRSVTPMEQSPPQVMNRKSRPRFALIAIIVLVACLIFAGGHNLQGLRLKLQELGSFLYHPKKMEQTITIKPSAETVVTTEKRFEIKPEREMVEEESLKGKQPITIKTSAETVVTTEKRFGLKPERETVEGKSLNVTAVQITPEKEPTVQEAIPKPAQQLVNKKPFMKLKREPTGLIEKSKATQQKAKPVQSQDLTVAQVQKKKEPLTPKTVAAEKSAATTQGSRKVLSTPAERQAPSRNIKLLGDVAVPSASADKDLRTIQTQGISENALPESLVPDEEENSSDADNKLAAISPKVTELQASLGTDTGHEYLQNRLDSFLTLYCQTYQYKQLDKFAAFFTTDATEDGKLFSSLMPKYRSNFKQFDSLDYRIELLRYSIQEKTGHIHIEGVFHAMARLKREGYGSEWRSSSGDISMELVEVGDSFRVRRLDYKLR